MSTQNMISSTNSVETFPQISSWDHQTFCKDSISSIYVKLPKHKIIQTHLNLYSQLTWLCH